MNNRKEENSVGCSIPLKEKDPGSGHLLESPWRKDLVAGTCLAMLLLLLFMGVFPAIADDSAYRKSYVKETAWPGKYLMHLEGSPYDIGYAMGHFRPDEVVKLVHGEYVFSMFNFVQPDSNAEIDPVMGKRVDELLRMPAIQLMLETMSRDVPYEYRLEMKGIADGTNDALHSKAVTYYHVLLVNLFPALQALTTSEQAMKYISLLFQDCQNYVAFGHATYDGRVLMGRHTMWVGDPTYVSSCIGEYVPIRGKRFIAVIYPGMVGMGTGLNEAGIGYGCNYFNARGMSRYPGGLGMWLLGRKILQYASSVADAERIIRSSDEIAPSFLTVGDAAGAGAVFEVFNHKVVPRFTNWVSTDHKAPDPIETREDLVVVTNHAFTPAMYLVDDPSAESLVRYQVITTLLLEGYGHLDQVNGRAIIDFMHPPRPYLTGENEKYSYGSDPAQPVKQCVAFMDLKTRTLWALYGRYNDPWVEFTLH